MAISERHKGKGRREGGAFNEHLHDVKWCAWHFTSNICLKQGGKLWDQQNGSQFYKRTTDPKVERLFSVNLLECGPTGIGAGLCLQALPAPLSLLQLNLLSTSCAECPTFPNLFLFLFPAFLGVSPRSTYKAVSSLTFHQLLFPSDNRFPQVPSLAYSELLFIGGNQ